MVLFDPLEYYSEGNHSPSGMERFIIKISIGR